MRGTPGVSIWQRNYHEHIIRNDASLNSIREYIVNNPLQWETDPENPVVRVTSRSLDNAPWANPGRGDQPVAPTKGLLDEMSTNPRKTT